MVLTGPCRLAYARLRVAGGVTTMVDMPYDDPQPIVSRALFEGKVAEVERGAYEKRRPTMRWNGFGGLG